MKSLEDADLEKLDEQLRLGQITGVRRVLRAVDLSSLKRSQILKAANLARRSALVGLGIKLLNPVVRSDKPQSAEATPQEKIEYSVLLAKIGATVESRTILNELDQSRYPDSILYETFSLTPEWRYAETIPLLKRYISLAVDQPYMKLVAEVNLVAAFVYLYRFDEADQLISTSIVFAKKNNHLLLYANLLELSAQSALERQDFDSAEKHLAEATKIMSGSETSESLYIEKWSAVLRASRRAGRIQREKLTVVREKAKLRGEYEVVRDCDFHLATKFHDYSRLKHLYFGTPYPSYREKLRRLDFSLAESLPYVWSPDSVAIHTGYEIDIMTAKDSSDREILRFEQLPHRLLKALTKDFYRPQRFAELGAELFQGEHYNPIHTPVKIHKACTRLRQELAKSAIQLKLVVHHGAVILKGSSTILTENIEAFQSAPVNSKHDVLFETVRSKYQGKRFTSQEAAKLWKCSVSTASRRIREGIELNFCEQVGVGRGAAFQLTSELGSAERIVLRALDR